jgi:hypothetical protein
MSHQEANTMTTATKVKSKTIDAWRIERDGVQLGFVIEGRNDWSAVLTSKRSVPARYMSAAYKTKEAAIAHLETTKESLIEMINSSLQQ